MGPEQPSATSSPESLTTQTRIAGALLGGAVGDAIGLHAERQARGEVPHDEEHAPDSGSAARHLRVTNATIATLFTVEGLIRAHVRGELKGMCHPPSVVQHAHLRWAHLQGRALRAAIMHVGSKPWPDGWLSQRAEVRVPRDGGATSLAALGSVVTLGDRADNDANDCDALVRAAPFGLVADESTAFRMARETSALTHPDPDGHLPAACAAMIIAALLAGYTWRDAIYQGYQRLEDTEVSERREELPPCATRIALDRAMDLMDMEDEDLEAALLEMRQTGVKAANEVLGLGVFLADRFVSFEAAVQFAAEVGGAAAASIAGQLWATRHGLDAIPRGWRESVELREVIEQLALDVASVRAETFDCRAEFDRYPGW